MIITLRYKVGIMAFWVGCIFLLSYFLLPSRLLKFVENRLKIEISHKVATTTDYLEKHKARIAILAKNQATISLCSLPFVDENSLSDYSEVLKKINWDSHLYSDLSIIGRNGTVIFSQKNKSLQGQNLDDPSFKNKPLGKIFNHIAMKQASDICFFQQTTNASKVLLIIVPILLKEGVVGFVFGELNTTDLYALLLKKHAYSLFTDVFLATAIDDDLTVLPLNEKQRVDFEGSTTYYEELLKASNGEMKTGIIFGKNLTPMIGSWQYHPLLEAGLLLVFAYKYVDYITKMLLFLMIFFFAIFFLLFKKDVFDCLKTCRKSIVSVLKIFIYPYLIYGVFGFLLAGIVFSGMNFYYHRQLNTKNSRIITFEKTRYIGHELNKKLFNLENTAEIIAQNLNKKNLSEEDLDLLIKPILSESLDIKAITIAFEPSVFKTSIDEGLKDLNKGASPIKEKPSSDSIFSPAWFKIHNGIDKRYLHKVYDYAFDPEGFWYQETIKNKSFWATPYFDLVSNKKIISYSTIFKDADGKIQGVVRVSFPLEILTSFLKGLGHETYQQCLIYTHTGKLIYHNNENYIAQNKTLSDLVPVTKKSLKDLVELYFKKYIPDFNRYHKKGLIPYASNKGYDELKTRWEFSLGFSNHNIYTPTYYTYYWLMLMIVCLLLAMFFGLLISIKDYFLFESRIYTFFDENLSKKVKNRVETYSKLKAQSYFIFFSLGCFLLWTMIYVKPWHHESEVLPIRDEGAVQQFLEDQEAEALRKSSAKLIPIKTGIMVAKLDDSKFPSLSVILQVWQTYTKEQLKTIEPGVILDKAEEMTATKISEKEEGDKISFSWKISARINQQVDLAAYPFDKKNFVLTFEPLDKKNNIICVPDFDKYTLLSNNQYSWLDNKEVLKNLETSFFSYNKKDQPLEILSMKKSLNLHVVMKENLLNTLISYCIPLFIALFSIFALLWVNTEKRISGFSGLFFATIFLHRSLRSTLNLHSIVYLEYLFLITYFTLLLITTGSIFFKDDEKKMKNIEFYFWPAQLTIWLVLAMLLFF